MPGWADVLTEAISATFNQLRWHLKAKFFGSSALLMWCTATRPSIEPRQKPRWSGKAAMQRDWYLSGDGMVMKGTLGWSRFTWSNTRKVPVFDWEVHVFDWKVPVFDWEAPVFDWRHFQSAALPPPGPDLPLVPARPDPPAAYASSSSSSS